MSDKKPLVDLGGLIVGYYIPMGSPYFCSSGPTNTYYSPDGTLLREEFRWGDLCHREDGPAVIYYRPDGRVCCETYCRNGQLHRDDGPAVIYYRFDGSANLEEFWCNGIKQEQVLEGP